MRINAFSRTVAHAYEAATSGEGWPRFLRTLCTALSVPAAGLTRHSLQPGTLLDVSAAHGLSEEALSLYASTYGRQDPRIAELRATGAFAPGSVRVVTSEQFRCASTLHRTSYFNDFGRRHGSIGHAGFTVADPTGRSIIGLTLPRPVEVAPYGADVLGALTLLTPHVVQALRLHDTLSPTESTSLDEVLNAQSGAMFLCLPSGRVVWENRADQALLTAGSHFCLDRGTLSSTSPLAAERIGHLIRAAARCRDGGSTQPRDVLLQFPRTTCRLWAAPVPGGGDGRTGLGRVHVLVSVGGRLNDESIEFVTTSVFGLTPVQARLTRALYGGRGTQNIARDLGVTSDAVRFHVKEVLRRTGAHHRVDLIRMIRAAAAAIGD